MSKHVPSQRLYFVVYCILIALTGLTVGASRFDLGPLHTAVGLIIATCKAVLVALFFMHLLYARRLTWIVLAASLLWLGILLSLTLTDYVTREWLAY